MGNIRRTIGTTSLVLAIGTGTFVGMYHYQTGAEYRPAAQARQLQANQVKFPDEDNVKQNKQDKDAQDEDRSALWKKDEKQNLEQGLKPVENAAYVFEGKDVGGDNSLSAGRDYVAPQESRPGEVYDITEDKDSADVVIRPDNNNSSDDSKDNSSDQNNGNGDKPDNNNTNSGGNGEENNKPNDPGKEDNDHKDDKNDNSNTPNKPDRKEPLSDTAVDEEVKKPDPGTVDASLHPEIFDEAKVSKESYVEPVIMADANASVQLYKGQKISDYDIFCALDTYVRNNKGKTYLWNEKHYGTYIRVSGVSFDGGETRNTKFPVTIPSDVSEGQMKLYVEYRMKKADAWSTKVVDYIPQDARCYILKEALTQENQKITSDMLLNSDKQYYNAGDTINLYYYKYMQDILGTGRIYSLLPGWTCKEEQIPWFYTVSAGRQILEPMDLIPLDSKYTVELPLVWLTNEGKVDPVNGYNLSCLQTLTHVESGGTVNNKLRLTSDKEETLVVPKYVQAVDIADPLAVEKLVIPDTVIYIADNEGGLQVEKAYQVDSKNSMYSSKDGILYSKKKDEILAIPCEVTSLDVPVSVDKITIPKENRLSQIRLEATTADQLPDLELDDLKRCKIILKDNLLKEYLINNQEVMQKNQCVVASEKDPGTTYSIKSGCIVSSRGSLYEVLDSNGSSVNLPSDVKSVDAGAFAEAQQVNTVVLSEDMEESLTFQQGCFADSGVDTIVCDNQMQYDNVVSQKEKFGKSEISVVMLHVSEDGYKYYIGTRDEKEFCRLIRAPKEVASFDGTIEQGKIVVTEIGDGAFSGNTSLELVTLPEEVKHIGQQAFYGCSRLQGILIDSRDSIYIGNKAFDACDSLRFVASNAMNATMQSDYNPMITSSYGTQLEPKKYFYILQGAQGYGDNTNNLSDSRGVEYFSLYDLGTEGKVLYGTHSQVGQWYAIRSTEEVPEHIKLPVSTSGIGDGAFADVKAATGSFDLNWGELDQLNCILSGAFQNSQLAGDIVIAGAPDVDGIEVYNSVFQGCSNITSVEIKTKINYLGENTFSQCENLKKVIFHEFKENMGIMAGTFDYSNQLTTLELNSSRPVKLEIHYPMSFQFNYGWSSQSEEAEHLRVVVPEEIRMQCIKDWRYLYLGCVSDFYGTSYLQLWDNVQWDMLDFETWEFPAPEVVDAEVKRQVLEAENVIRKTLGMQEVTEPTDLYLYREEQGNIILTGVPSYIRDVILSAETLELPEDWYLDEIASGAFAGATDLESVTILNSLSVIHKDFLRDAGENSDGITLTFEENPDGVLPTLSGGSEEAPFTFGVEDEKVRLDIAKDCREAYIAAWKYQMLGYENEDAMRDAVTRELRSQDESVSDQEILQEMQRRVAPQEQRLRAMLVDREA